MIRNESAWLGNISCSNWIVSLAVWHVASFCWNHILAISISLNFGRKNCIIMSPYRAPLIVAACSALFSKKYNPMMPVVQNAYQTVTRCRCICFSLITCEFPEPQTRQFWRLTKSSKWKCASSLILRPPNFNYF